jgi:hypothetical protein
MKDLSTEKAIYLNTPILEFQNFPFIFLFCKNLPKLICLNIFIKLLNIFQ